MGFALFTARILALSPSMSTKTKQDLAKTAETKVCHWLELQGWRIIRRNYRGLGFDFAALKNRVLVIGEVKSRPKLTHIEQIAIEELVKTKQLRSIIKGTDHLIGTESIDYDVIRIDLFVVIGRGQNQLARYKNIGLNI